MATMGAKDFKPPNNSSQFLFAIYFKYTLKISHNNNDFKKKSIPFFLECFFPKQIYQSESEFTEPISSVDTSSDGIGLKSISRSSRSNASRSSRSQAPFSLRAR